MADTTYEQLRRALEALVKATEGHYCADDDCQLEGRLADARAALALSPSEGTPAHEEQAFKKGVLEGLATEFEHRATMAGESCAPGCCSSAIREARWEGRSQGWSEAARHVRAAMDKPPAGPPEPKAAPAGGIVCQSFVALEQYSTICGRITQGDSYCGYPAHAHPVRSAPPKGKP